MHEGFALWESSVILEYLEDRFPAKPLLPSDPKGRATARRIIAEADHWLAPAQRELLEQTLFRREAEPDPAGLVAAQETVLGELARFEAMLAVDYFAGPLSFADFTVYPYLRMLRRIDERQPGRGIGDRMPKRLAAWMARIEALPCCAKTIPPHWKG